MQRVTSLLLCVALTLSTFALTACNKDSIPLAQAGYQLHVYAHAGARVGNAFNVLKPEKLPNATYGRLLLALGTASEIGERVFKTIDASEQITPGDKVALIAQIDQYITVLDGVLGDNLITQLLYRAGPVRRQCHQDRHRYAQDDQAGQKHPRPDRRHRAATGQGSGHARHW
jgi:hypothetical protein